MTQVQKLRIKHVKLWLDRDRAIIIIIIIINTLINNNDCRRQLDICEKQLLNLYQPDEDTVKAGMTKVQKYKVKHVKLLPCCRRELDKYDQQVPSLYQPDVDTVQAGMTKIQKYRVKHVKLSLNK